MSSEVFIVKIVIVIKAVNGKVTIIRVVKPIHIYILLVLERYEVKVEYC
jgi:hypothetical protein